MIRENELPVERVDLPTDAKDILRHKSAHQLVKTFDIVTVGHNIQAAQMLVEELDGSESPAYTAKVKAELAYWRGIMFLLSKKLSPSLTLQQRYGAVASRR